MKSIDVSIIIPVYNVEAFIAECLQSVMAQTSDANIECLVVDDCGSDRSMEVAMQTIAKYSGPIDFRIIQRECNGGLSAARNSGIRNAHGRYIYFLDSDDLITPDCIEVLYSAAKKYPSAQIVVGSLESFPDKEKFKWMTDMLHELPPFSDNVRWIRSKYFRNIPVISWNKLELRKFIVDNNLYFREGILHEDEHWMALSYPHVKSMAFVDKITYLYRMREGSITNRPDSDMKKIENMTVILAEMFSRQMKWDRPLFMWAEWWLEYLKNVTYADPKITQESLKSHNALYHTILANPTIPMSAKFVTLNNNYYSLPRGHYLINRFFLRLAFGKPYKDEK